MAEFTLTLKEVLEITPDIGLGEYPIFDEEYREQLNKKIIDHYFMQEIGAETIEMFRLFLRRKMNEVMPFYNQLYESERLKVDPFSTISLSTINSTSETTNSRVEGTSKGTNTTGVDARARVVNSNTPQGRLNGNADYASAATDSTSKTDTTANANEENSQNQSGQQRQEGNSVVTGYQGSQTEMLMRFRETFLNIDMMILDELGPLFMLVWSSGNNFTQNNPNYYRAGFPLYGRF